MSGFKDHFSGHAAVYRDARPSYPAALFDWLAERAPSRRLAWDAGCGNGQASVALAARFGRVIATDPSAAQVAHAEARPNIDYRIEAAERASLDAASVDLVTVAQALHWFDVGAFHAEVQRVLRPGGLVAAWSYADCTVMPEVDRHVKHLYRDLVGPYWPAERRLVETGYRTVPFPFEPVAAPVFAMRVDWDVQALLAYLRSWSASQRHLAATGCDAVAQVEAAIREAWGEPGVRTVCWELHLRCGRVLRAA
ncbi:MAG: methyltransferase domain-containing protein [Xanthomonadales bacterium]|nr:methyltransferase domain-containing protein [Xanthomonadales bacterium]